MPPLRLVARTSRSHPQLGIELQLCAAALLAAPSLAHTSGLDPAQLVSTTDRTSPEPIGDQAAVDGDSAIVLGGPINRSSPLARLRALVLERGGGGLWSEVQAIDIPLGTNPLGDGTVAIEGDIAAVFVRRTISLGFSRTHVPVFERDALGVWSLTRSLDGGTPMSKLGPRAWWTSPARI